MKIRTDFVTNSSSSSFIIARKPEMNEKQKEAVLRFVEKEFLGRKIIGPESTEEEINKIIEEEWDFYDEEKQEKIRTALKSGRSIYEGNVIFDDMEYDIADLFEQLWTVMEENGDGDFEGIDTDLIY